MKKRNKKPKSSLVIYILGNLLAMLVVILFSIDMINITYDHFAKDQIRSVYFEVFPDATKEEEKAFEEDYLVTGIIHYEPAYSELYRKLNMKMALFSSYATLSLYIFVIIIIILFGIKIIIRLSKELKKLDQALEHFSQSALVNNELSEINSKIKEFNNICGSYNRLMEKLKASEEERKQLEDEQRQMIADISHDIKTPITVMQGYAKAISDDIIDDDTKRKYLDSICRKSETVAELVNTLHEYSKLEHPHFDFNMEEGDLCEYLRSYLAMKYQDLELAGFELEAELPDEEIMFSFDHKQLSRVFENLITNSYRHNPPETAIYAAMKESGGDIIINIGDNGRGIPEELRKTIFEPFVVGNKSRTGTKGSGLGLAISRKIVEAHNGTISLADDPEGRMKTMYEIVLHRA